MRAVQWSYRTGIRVGGARSIESRRRLANRPSPASERIIGGRAARDATRDAATENRLVIASRRVAVARRRRI